MLVAVIVPHNSRECCNLINILEKGAAYAETKKIDPNVLINSRLSPDMFPLSKQVQIASDIVNRGAARLAGIDEHTRLALIAQITTAFDGVKREDGITLHQARALDDYTDPQKARKLDSESQWQDIPDEWIEYFFDVFPFFDAKGFRYYIPAYIIWCLKHYKNFNSNTLDYTISVLKNREGYYRPYFQLFHTDQLQTIAAFLQFMNNFYPSTV